MITPGAKREKRHVGSNPTAGIHFWDFCRWKPRGQRHGGRASANSGTGAKL